MGLQSVTFTKEGVGVVTVVGDPPDDEEFKVKHIDFGEYVDLSGNRYALTQKQALGIVQLASTEWHALLIADCEDEGDVR